MNAILLHSNNGLGSTTHVAFFRVMRTRIQYNDNVSESLNVQKV